MVCCINIAVRLLKIIFNSSPLSAEYAYASVKCVSIGSALGQASNFTPTFGRIHVFAQEKPDFTYHEKPIVP